MQTRSITFALAFALVGLHGLIPAPPLEAQRQQQQMMADIRMLQEQTAQLQIVLGSVTEALQTVAGKLDEQVSANRKSFADQKLLIDGLADGVRILREKMDDTNVRISSLSQELEAIRMMVPAGGFTGPEAGGPAPGEPDGEPWEDADPAPAAPLAPGTTPAQLFDLAFTDFTAGQWAMAIAGFEAYIKSFPRTPQAAEAQFYIGQAYYLDGRFEEAVTAFDRLIAGYPGARILPDGYYKLGVALERVGQVDRARQAFEFVIQNYPDSNMAYMARQAIERLNRPVR
jgi:tol-pal system protein YbgF